MTNKPSGPNLGYAVADIVLDANYLTAGKAYPVLKVSDAAFVIKDDEGDLIYCAWERCAHLYGLNWRREVSE